MEVISDLQEDLEFEYLIRYFIEEKLTQAFFDMIEFSKLNQEIRTKVIMMMFKESMAREELALAMRLWHKFEKVLTKNHRLTCIIV